MKNLLLVAAVVALMAAPAYAYWETGFEAPTYTGSPGGTLLTGQDQWFNPVAGSADYLVFTYADNAYGFAPNPAGGDQFTAGRSNGGTAYGRAERPVDFSGMDVWTIEVDLAAQWLGGPVSASHYLGGFSLQPLATNTHLQTLNIWQDLANPGLWMANYITQEHHAPGISPGPAWTDLQPNHWYRQSTTFRFSDRLILSVSITDLTTGVTTTVDDPGWHLIPGNGMLPTGVRFFTGGTVAGNTMAWDNLIIPEPATLLLLAVGALGLFRRR